MKPILLILATLLLPLRLAHANLLTAFERPSKPIRTEVFQRSNIGPNRQSNFRVVYRVPIELGGDRHVQNATPLPKRQFSDWKQGMKRIRSDLKTHKISPATAKAQAWNWTSRNGRN
jgi:hypothetical protein